MNAPVFARFALHTAEVPANQLQLIEWSCVESVCAPFRLELVAACSLYGAEDLAARLLGQRAVFSIHGPSGQQARRGIVAEARVEGGLDRDKGRLRVVLVPRLALLDHKVDSRIFQHQTAPEILAKVLGEWHLDHELRLAGDYPQRPYFTQYRESDLSFLTRLCAKEGLGFFLEQRPFDDGEATDPGEEKLVLVDRASFQPPIAGGTTLIHTNERFGTREDEVSGFSLGHAVRPEFVRLGDFDFRRPGLTLSALSGLSQDQRTPIGASLGGEQLGVFLHAQRADRESAGAAPEIDDELAQIRLEQLRQNADVGRGRSRSVRLQPGSTFSIDGHPIGSLNRVYVVTRVEHVGRTPEQGEAGEGEAGDVYVNDFECVPASVLCRAPIRPVELQQTLETATVVGPKGDDLHCDEHGRIKVQFHWDLGGNRDEHSSCWLRVAQPWAGASWGAQFIPRIGAEVLVGFLGGDVDQPVVLGSLYNGARPHPFRLPEEASYSGFRSQSTPDGDGCNELVFDDDRGRERLVLRAERNFEQVVDNDLSVSVANAEQVRVGGTSQRTVSGDAETTILGECTESLAKGYQMTVQGSHGLSVDGDSEIRVSGNRTSRLEGCERVEHYGQALPTYYQDQVVRVLGHQITVVGQHDARRSATVHVEGTATHSSTGTTELSSDKDIVLRVGDSSLRLTPEGIELVTKKITLLGDELQTEAKEKLAIFAGKQLAFNADKIDAIAKDKLVLKGKQGQLQLDDNARLDGTMVKLNCSPDPVEEGEPPPYEPPQATKIKLADQDGKPLPGRRFVVVAGDGSERSGTLDDNGEAELFLEEGGEIIFPDADNPRQA
ncbi:MAG: type VI secretion system tip protein VgrG [Deltaproteobacteria bacterium]|jgi:type VI secretion system secreted protein VgrG|nr:type VI secretion system tip protein VgrG [Deltaproteobacteria bacterium]MBW2533061.1 type VI secretion system tip protein VgrG [Deltaproteobacteria bacterium]